MREDEIHYSIRAFLKNSGWELIAGQYPNGSDDELPPLNIVDPTLAKDNSPDHRRHSKNKLVPDLIAYRGNIMLLIEMKPRYSRDDEKKLDYILSNRYRDFINALHLLRDTRGANVAIAIEDLTIVPSLGFGGPYPKNVRDDFCYFRVKQLLSVEFHGNAIIPTL